MMDKEEHKLIMRKINKVVNEWKEEWGHEVNIIPLVQNISMELS